MSVHSQIQTVSFPRSQKAPKLREVRFEDHAQIKALTAQYELNLDDYDKWMHLWTNNPAYREIKGHLPMGWVLDNGEGAISGYLGNVPLNYELEGNRLVAATTRAWVVDTPYRSYSPLLLGTYFQQRNVDIFLSTTVNSQSAPAYCTFQSVPVPVGAWDRTLFWITHYPGFVESFLRQRHAAMAKALSYPLSTGVFLRDRLKRHRLESNGTTVSVAPSGAFDDRFEAFWAALRKKKARTLLAVRSQEVLQWHFKYALLKGTAWIYVIEGKSGLVAYSVFLRHDYRRIGLTRMRLADFQSLDDEKSPELLTAMLRAALHRSRQESIQMLEVVGLPAGLERRLEGSSPHRRTLSQWLYFYKANNPSLAKTLNNPDLWEPWLFDGDSTL
jgi:hypothetical protein